MHAPALSSLPYTVVRIRAGDSKNSDITHYGTGFFFGKSFDGENHQFIVSNKHVLCNKNWIEVDFAMADTDGKRIIGPPHVFRFEKGQLPIFVHENIDVDLACIPLAPIGKYYADIKQNISLVSFNNTNIPDLHASHILDATTTILMPGFPNGIMDTRNNFPIIRRGILSTPYNINYLGKPDFVADIGAFGGSSGSPILGVFENMFREPNGSYTLIQEPKTYLIGVLHSGPTLSLNGEIVTQPIPTSGVNIKLNIMMHLAYCVKSTLVEKMVEKIISMNKTM
jgi:hypothetical protein